MAEQSRGGGARGTLATAPSGAARLDALFHARSIAIVGASERNYYSQNAFRNLVSAGFSGSIGLVNRRGEEVFGRPSVTSLHDLDEVPELAVVAVPAEAVYDVLEEFVEIGGRAAVIVSAGFAELEDAEGRSRVEALHGLLDRSGLVVCGPSCLGILSVESGAHAYTGSMIELPRLGGLSFVSQSGGAMRAAMDGAAKRGLGFTYLASTGAEVNTDASQFVSYFLDDPRTRAVCCFIEQFRNPAGLISASEKARRLGKPIIALKVGRSSASARMAEAHTGAMTGSDDFNVALFDRLGVVRVDSIESMLDAASSFAQGAARRRPVSRTLGVVSVSGGTAAVVADLAAERGWAVPLLADQTRDRVAAALPEGTRVQNPIELSNHIQTHDLASWENTVGAFADDPGLDVVVTMELHPVSPERVREASSIAERADATVAMVSVSPWIDVFDPVTAALADELGIMRFIGPDSAIRAIETAAAFDARPATDLSAFEAFVGRGPSEASIATFASDDVTARALMSAHGVPVPREELATTPAEAARIAAEFGGRVVLKAVSPHIAHRAKVGLVALDIDSAERAEAEATTLLDRVQSLGVAYSGVSVQEQASGAELFVGVNCDAGFAPMLVLAQGGVDVEEQKDIVSCLLPATDDEILDSLRSLPSFRELLRGQGRAEDDVSDILDAIRRIADVALENFAELSALEVNPLMIGESAVWAVDCLIRLKK